MPHSDERREDERVLNPVEYLKKEQERKVAALAINVALLGAGWEGLKERKEIAARLGRKESPR